MWLLITFITIWAISPGPVVIMTIHEARKRGAAAGVTVAAGAGLTALLMVLTALLIYATGLSTILDSEGMVYIERLGAVGIIALGLYSGFRSLIATESAEAVTVHKQTKVGFVQGMGVMATGVPQALLFYNVIMPQTVAADEMVSTIVALGALKVVLIFGFHAVVALMAAHSHGLSTQNRFKKGFELVLALLLVLMGTNILV